MCWSCFCRLKIPFLKRSAGSSPAVRTTVILAAAMTLLAGCERRPDDIPVVVSVIDGPAIASPARSQKTRPVTRMLAASTAQGLVRFDANGGIEPGLAERWIVRDDGRSFIFRLRDAEWPDGRTVTTGDVVLILRRVLGPRSDNALAPYLTAIDEIVAMTPQVIEVRLKGPRPDLLKLFAQPELALPAADGRGGSGPFRIDASAGPGTLLRPAFDPARSPDDEPQEPTPEEFVRIRGERAAAAILRFADKKSDLVLGGSLGDWPLIALAEIAPRNIRIDNAAGLFGLAIASRQGFLADPANRAAVALAIDAAAVTAAFREGWPVAETILPERLDSATEPAKPIWSGVALSDRRSTAQARVTAFGQPVRLRIAVPVAPGGTILYAQIGSALRRIGIAAERVGMAKAADLRLVDVVAPYDSARWYLRAACQPCGEPVAAMIAAVREAPDVASRARLLSAADVALAKDVAFIPVARPLRWSLVAARLRAFAPNPRAFHPLNHLRADTN